MPYTIYSLKKKCYKKSILLSIKNKNINYELSHSIKKNKKRQVDIWNPLGVFCLILFEFVGDYSIYVNFK